MTLSIPPLRERPSEIAALASLFLSRAAVELGRPAPALSAEVVERLKRYIWPGNIRELRNMMERAALLCSASVVTLDHLPLEKMSDEFGRSTPLEAPPTAASLLGVDKLLADDERQRVISALEHCAGNQTHAARMLGMARNTLLAASKNTIYRARANADRRPCLTATGAVARNLGVWRPPLGGHATDVVGRRSDYPTRSSFLARGMRRAGDATTSWSRAHWHDRMYVGSNQTRGLCRVASH
jgi:hypothetical protein